MIILITPVTHEYISVLRKNKTESIYSVYKTVPKHSHNKHPSEHEARLETNPSPQKNFTSRRTKALEKLSYNHDGVSPHSYMNIFQLICDDHMVPFGNKNKDERTHCP